MSSISLHVFAVFILPEVGLSPKIINICTQQKFPATVKLLYNRHIRNRHFVPYSEGSQTQELPVYFSVGVVLHILLLNTMWLCFQSFPLLHTGKEGNAGATTWSNSANLMSIVAAMLDNLAKRG